MATILVAIHSQMQRACEDLEIEIIFANSPQCKGRIERSFDTFRGRLVPELQLHKIADMENANRYLQEEFIPNYWVKLSPCCYIYPRKLYEYW